jgi:hypothetical protein
MSDSVFSRIGLAFLLADPKAIGWFFSFSAALIKRQVIVRFDPYPLNTSGILHFLKQPFVLSSCEASTLPISNDIKRAYSARLSIARYVLM